MTISATKVHFDEHTMTVDLTDGRALRVPLAWFPRLLRATPAERAQVEISRVGLHWEQLDEDISIAGLLAGRGDVTKSARSVNTSTEIKTRSGRGASAPSLSAQKLASKGLDARHRDTTGEIHHKMGNTRIGTLRKTYGEHFAAGWRSDMKLNDLLKETGAKSISDFRKNYNKRA
jgi:hypothetical protein